MTSPTSEDVKALVESLRYAAIAALNVPYGRGRSVPFTRAADMLERSHAAGIIAGLEAAYCIASNHAHSCISRGRPIQGESVNFAAAAILARIQSLRAEEQQT